MVVGALTVSSPMAVGTEPIPEDAKFGASKLFFPIPPSLATSLASSSFLL
jgi:hypothetical protein